MVAGFCFNVIRLAMLALTFVSYASGWYDTTTTVKGLHSLKNSSLPKAHNPKDGLLLMRKRQRSDAEVLRLLNTIKARQSKTPKERQERYVRLGRRAV